MVGANYTGGRRSAAKARSKDTTARLQRGHFSKQRLGILTNALRSRPDHQSLSRSRPWAAADNPNLNSACTPAATVYDISLGHAQRDLAQKQRQRRQSTQRLRSNDGLPFSPSKKSGQPCLDPSILPPVTSIESSASLALNSAHSLQTLLPATASAAIPSCATPSSPSHPQPRPNSRPEPAFRRASLPEHQPTPVTEMPSKRRSKILDLLDISDRKRLCFVLRFLDLSTACARHTTPQISARLAVYYILYRTLFTPHAVLCILPFYPTPDHRSRDNPCSSHDRYCGNPLLPRVQPNLVPPSSRSSVPFDPSRNAHLFPDYMLHNFTQFPALLYLLTTLRSSDKCSSPDRPNTRSAELARCHSVYRHPRTRSLSRYR